MPQSPLSDGPGVLIRRDHLPIDMQLLIQQLLGTEAPGDEVDFSLYVVVGQVTPITGSDNWLKAWASNPEVLIRNTTITRDANGAATAAGVVWPDGTPGVFAGTPSTSFPGAVDAYTVTYVPAGGTSKTVTQPALTRATSGAVTQRPAMTVA